MHQIVLLGIFISHVQLFLFIIREGVRIEETFIRRSNG